jgi:predicted RNA-binding protein YlqC (UPF0109 family)
MPQPSLPGLIDYLARQIVDQPDKVTVTEVDLSDQTVIELEVDPQDLGKVIGKGGRTIKAMRALLQAASVKTRRRTVLEIID